MQNSFSVPLTQLPTDLLMQAPERLRARGNTSGGDNAGELKRVAREFESLFVGYLLKVMRETVEESDGAEGGLGKTIYTELFDQELSRELARQGALGISDLLVKHLSTQGVVHGAEGAGQQPADEIPAGLATPHIRERSAVEQPDSDIPDFQLPVSAPVSSSFGTRMDPFTRQVRFHRGLDLAAPAGTEVRAAMAGEVVLAGYQQGYGNTVVVQHAGGVQTRYAHLGPLQVNKGDPVAAEQVLGSVGSTGRSTGPHIHFEVTRFGAQVDPVAYTGE